MLLVLALALVIAIRSGDTSRRETGATVGKQWVGAAGISRSVGALKSTPVRATEPASEPDAESEPLGHAASQQAGQKVREKPEPGEGPAGPSAPGHPVPQQRVGQAAITANSSLSAGTSFLGAQVSESGFIPPDSMGSVGPSQILVSVNGRIKVFDKQGNLGGLNMSDSTFWSSVDNGVAPTDPGVEYDRLTGRWIVSAVNVASTNNRVMLAVSSGPTITDQSSFTFFQFAENFDGGDAGLFADYPQMAVDANAIYIGVNDFSGNSFAHSTVFVIRKSSVLGAGPIVVSAFRNLTNGSGGPGPFSPQPAEDMDPSVGQGYIVGPDAGAFSQLDVRRISDPGGTPSISGNLTISVPTTANPLSVPASGSHHNLDALDSRLFEAMIGRAPDGTLSLWTAHNIRVNSSGVGSSVGDRDGARWYQLGNLTSDPPTLTQSGTLFDPTATTSPRFFWIPSIAINGQGHASLNASTAGSNNFAEVASSGHLATDLSGTTEPFDLTQSSSSAYNLGTPNPQRWGDYSQTVVDPTDNMTFWTFQEYANATNSWGLRVIKLKPPSPATPSAASPATIPTGQSSVTVQLTGTQVNGSGFFDPGSDPGGPGWANHLAASVPGGVTVNSVTYVDPTHVTLDLNTTGASNGSKDVTITNPDGQSTTGSNVLVVGTPDPPAFTGTNPASPANNNSPKILGTAAAGTTVKLFTNSSCSGSPVATGTAAAFASPGVSVSVADDTTPTFYATATDASNNTSNCSSTLPSGGSITYVEDSTPPAAPSITSTNPASPASLTTPKVIGTSSSDTATVRIFTQANCGGSVQASGSKATFESTGIQVTVGANQATTLSAAALDAAGNPSSCSSSNVTYVEDSAPPAAPTGLTSSPTSPANNSNPKILGSAEAGSTVKLFTNSGCSGSPTATGSASTFASPGIAVTVADNTTTTFYATATDVAGNPSSCSSSNVTYVEDSAPPAAPTGLTSSPTSPANNSNPKILGSAEAGSTVRIYTDAACSPGSLAATGSAAAFASPGITVTVPNNSTTTFYATATDAAGNASSCSSSNVTYQEDSNIPVEPTVTGTAPVSPANDSSPRVLGTAPPNTTVTLYTDQNCVTEAGSPPPSGSSSTFASPGITVSVPANSITTLYARATDAASNVSACSTSSVTYVEDSTPPTVGVTGGPSGTTSDTKPTFTFSGSDAMGPVSFHCSIDTGTAAFRACSGPGKSDKPASPLADGAYTFRVRAADAAGNSAVATRSFAVSAPKAAAPPDTTITAPPDTTITKAPKKKTTKRRPKFKFASNESATFECQLDSGPFRPCSSPFFPPKLRLGKHVFRVRAVNQTGITDPTPPARKFRVVP